VSKGTSSHLSVNDPVLVEDLKHIKQKVMEGVDLKYHKKGSAVVVKHKAVLRTEQQTPSKQPKMY